MKYLVTLTLCCWAICAGSTAVAQTDAKTADKPERTEQEVRDLIREQGRSQPDWWGATPLDYPPTLDLSWPLRPPTTQWNNQRNVGQYIWDVINPNPSKWRSGIRLVHALLMKQQNDETLRVRDMKTLAKMYYSFEQDYARAAFWWETAGVKAGVNDPAVTKLAICYWKLGNKKMGYDLLAKSPIYYDTIKVLADMGYTDVALNLADRIKSSSRADLVYLYAGDACRAAGRYDDAISYYQKVETARPTDSRMQKAFNRSIERARANISAIRIYEQLDLANVKDGTYTGSALGYVGPITVAVTVKDHKISEVKVTSHKEKQCYSAISDTPEQIVDRQGVQGVDAVSGATITSEAIVNAVARALSRASM